jgi:hypothetical protein
MFFALVLGSLAGGASVVLLQQWWTAAFEPPRQHEHAVVPHPPIARSVGLTFQPHPGERRVA